MRVDPKKNKQGRKNSQDMKHLDLDTTNTASSMEATGLIPANPQNADELDAYEELYDLEYDIDR